MNFFRCLNTGFKTSGQKSGAFTLAELMITMLIIGVIMTFAIPKVLSAQADTRKNAIIKETVAALSETVQIGRMSGYINVSNYGDYMLTHINALKICPSNAYTEGCWDISSQNDIPSEANQPGMVLHNGATLMGIDNGCCELSPQEWCNGLVLDWNGPAGPNMMGDDQILVEVNYGNVHGQTGWCDDNRMGTVNIEVTQAGAVWGF